MKFLCGVVATCVLAACVSPVTKADAASPPPPGFFGMIVGGAQTQAEYQTMARGGTDTIRSFVSWTNVDRVPGARDWREYDVVFTQASLAGMRVLPTLFGTPASLAAKPATLPVQTAAQRRGWTEFVTAAATRYGPNGEFWSLNPSLPYLPVMDWQVWNEPNIDEFVAGRSNPKKYAQLVTLTDSALDAVGAPHQVGLAGLFRRPRDGTGIPMVEFLTRFYRIPGIKKRFDAVSVHPYSKKPADALQTLREAKVVMNRAKDSRKQMWVTELGWATGGVGLARSPYQATYAQQAQKLSSSYRLLLKNRSRLRLTRLTWHLWRDVQTPPNLWNQYMGLFDASGQPKPAWFAYTKATGGTP